MVRIKALACCGLAAACLTMALSSCSSQQTYTPPEKSPTLSTPTIGKANTLRVGVNASTAPLAGKATSSSKIVGIDVDVAAALADSLGLKLEIVDVGTDPESALKDNKVDMVMGIDQATADTPFWISDPYLPSSVALFSTTGNTQIPTKASTPKIAVQVSSKSSWPVTNEFGDDAIVPENDLKSAFTDLSSGSVQYVAADAVIGMYAAHSNSFDASIVALLKKPGGYCIGVSDANSDLKQALSDALTTLSGSGIVSVIETKWLGEDLNVADVPLTEGAKTAKSDEGKTAANASAKATAAHANTGADSDATNDNTAQKVDNAGDSAVELQGQSAA